MSDYDYPQDDSLTDDYRANEEAIASYEWADDREYANWREQRLEDEDNE